MYAFKKLAYLPELTSDLSESSSDESPHASDTLFNLLLRGIDLSEPTLFIPTTPPIPELSLRAELNRIYLSTENHARISYNNSSYSSPNYLLSDSITPNTINGTGPEQASSNKLPEFKLVGQYNGKIPATCWLHRLTDDFRQAGQYPPSPSLFLESVEILLEGAPAKKLDSNPRIRSIMDQLEKATQEDMDTVKQWLKDEYPVDVADLPVTGVAVSPYRRGNRKEIVDAGKVDVIAT
ncbi:hypothetical protein ACMFMG_003035 [Clarireedia jacksonii]